MASTNQTANLHLNQWAESDPVKREDFNADNAKLDAAVGNRALVRLASGTLTEAVETLTLNLQSFDPGQYRELILEAVLRSAGDSTDAGCNVYYTVNGIQTSTYRCITKINDGNSYQTGTSLRVGGGIARYRSACHRLTLFPMSNGLSGYLEVISRDASSYQDSMLWRRYAFMNDTVNVSTLSSVEITTANLLATGSEYTLYGMKK